MHSCALKTSLYSNFALPWRCDIMEYSSFSMLAGASEFLTRLFVHCTTCTRFWLGRMRTHPQYTIMVSVDIRCWSYDAGLVQVPLYHVSTQMVKNWRVSGDNAWGESRSKTGWLNSEISNLEINEPNVWSPNTRMKYKPGPLFQILK